MMTPLFGATIGVVFAVKVVFSSMSKSPSSVKSPEKLLF